MIDGCVGYSDGFIVAESRGNIEKDGHRRLSTVGAVYDKQGQLINRTFREAPDSVFVGENYSPQVSSDSIGKLTGSSIYLGVLHWHFGHFMIETIPRFWIFLENPELLDCDNFIFQAWGNLSSTALFSPPIRRIFELFKIPLSKIKLVSESLSLESVYVPDSSWNILDKPDARFLTLTDFIRDSVCKEKNKGSTHSLFLSRARLAPDQRRIVNESAFVCSDDTESTQVFHPQEHSLDEQVQIVSSAEKIVAFEGTALYMAMFFSRRHTNFVFMF